MGDIRIGTSGYDYLDWREAFYPAGLERERFLQYYSTRFSTVELNFSYYRIPTREQLSAILARGGDALDFSIKAHESLTHRITTGWKDAARVYRLALDPLIAAERLSAVLFQFPYRFHYTVENRQYLDRLLAEMAGLPAVVEFRNAEWLTNRVFDKLRERRVGFCSVDAPPLKGIPPSLDIVTADPAYIRFHGRNEQTWWGSDAAARFDYRYSEEELAGWVPRIMAMIKSSQTMRIFFNNHRRGQAPENAMMLQKLLEAEGIGRE